MQPPERILDLDRSDPLAHFRGAYRLDPGRIYLDGNSLGALPERTAERVERCLATEWGQDLIASWNRHDWIGLPQRTGNLIASLIGAAPGEVVATCTTSANILKALSAAIAVSGGRCEIVLADDEFPTDAYIAAGLERFGLAVLRRTNRREIASALSERTAAVLVSHAHYRSADLIDLGELAAGCRRAGALSIVDLSHSTGAVPVDLNGAGIDFAVGCGYKYLNGGPGAPAYIFAASRLHDRIDHLLAGWLGHADPFAFEGGYRPARGITRFLSGTPAILSMTALISGVELICEAGVDRLHAKTQRLSELFLEETRELRSSFGLELISSDDPSRRGGHLSFRHPRAQGIAQALINRGVTGDFRAPDCLRLGFAASYLSYADVWRATCILRSALDAGEHLVARADMPGPVT